MNVNDGYSMVICFQVFDKRLSNLRKVSMDYDAEVEKAIGRSSKCFPVFVKIVIPTQAEGGSHRSSVLGVVVEDISLPKHDIMPYQL